MQLTPEQMLKYARECTWAELEKEAAPGVNLASGALSALTNRALSAARGGVTTEARVAARSQLANKNITNNPISRPNMGVRTQGEFDAAKAVPEFNKQLGSNTGGGKGTYDAFGRAAKPVAAPAAPAPVVPTRAPAPRAPQRPAPTAPGADRVRELQATGPKRPMPTQGQAALSAAGHPAIPKGTGVTAGSASSGTGAGNALAKMQTAKAAPLSSPAINAAAKTNPAVAEAAHAPQPKYEVSGGLSPETASASAHNAAYESAVNAVKAKTPAPVAPTAPPTATVPHTGTDAAAKPWYNEHTGVKTPASLGERFGGKDITKGHAAVAGGVGGVGALGTGYMLGGSGRQKQATVAAMYEARLVKRADGLPWELDHPYLNEFAHMAGGSVLGTAGGAAVGVLGGPPGMALGANIGGAAGALAGTAKTLYDHHQAANTEEAAHGRLPFVVRHPYVTDLAANMLLPGVGRIISSVGHAYAKDGYAREQHPRLKSAAEQMYEVHLAEAEKAAGAGAYMEGMLNQFGKARAEGQGIMQSLREGHAAAKVESTAIDAGRAASRAADHAAREARTAAAGGHRPRPTGTGSTTPIGGEPAWHAKTIGQTGATYGQAAKVTAGTAALGAAGFGANKLTQPHQQEYPQYQQENQQYQPMQG